MSVSHWHPGRREACIEYIDMASKTNQYDIDLAQLKDNGLQEYDFHIGPGFFADRDNSDIVGADVDVHLSVRRRHDSYTLEFECDGLLQAPCDRCLDPVDVPVGVDYDVCLKYGDEFDDVTTDGLIVIPFSWTRFDVAPIIYDTLLLSIPLRCVHPDGQCNPLMAESLRQHGSSIQPDEDSDDPTQL